MKTTHRVIVAIAGSFRAKLDGEEVRMDDPTVGWLVPAQSWLELTEFTPDAICLVIASTMHSDDDVIKERA